MFQKSGVSLAGFFLDNVDNRLMNMNIVRVFLSLSLPPTEAKY